MENAENKGINACGFGDDFITLPLHSEGNATTVRAIAY